VEGICGAEVVVDVVIEKGKPLWRSGGEEYKDDEGDQKLSRSQKLGKQRKALLDRLGLEGGDKLRDNAQIADEMISDQDILAQGVKMEIDDPKLSAASDVVQGMETQTMSARQRNLEKRKAKNKRKAEQMGGTDFAEIQPSKIQKTKTAVTSQGVDESMVVIDSVVDLSAQPGFWPFTSFCDQLLHEVFHPNWEIRHGAALGLKAIIIKQGHAAGLPLFVSDEEEKRLRHKRWVVDCAIRLLIIFALDRFADHTSGQAVAPIREACAQVLGALIQYADEDTVEKVCTSLLQLEKRDHWEHKHSSFVGLKFVLAVRTDLSGGLLNIVLPVLIRGLRDKSDDVRSVVAESLLSIVDEIPVTHGSVLPELMNTLWSTLDQLDELTASTNGVMTVISRLYSNPVANKILGRNAQELPVYIRKLFPFLRHSISSVRETSLSTMLKLLQFSDTSNLQWFPSLLDDFLFLTFRNILLEVEASILHVSFEMWNKILEFARLLQCSLASSTDRLLWIMTSTADVDLSQPMLLLNEESESLDPLSFDVRMRLNGSKAISSLVASLNPAEFASAQQFLVNMLKSNSVTQRTSAAVVWECYFETPGTVPLSQLPSVSEALLDNFKFSQFCSWSELDYHIKQITQQLRNLYEVVPEAVANFPFPKPMSPDVAVQICQHVKSSLNLNPTVATIVSVLEHTLHELNRIYCALNDSCSAANVAAVIAAKEFVEKMGVCIKVLQRSISGEEQLLYQERAASAIASLMHQRVGQKPCPNNSILKAFLIYAVETLDRRQNAEDEVVMTVQTRGGQLFIQAVASRFGSSLFDDLPFLFKSASNDIQEIYQSELIDDKVQNVKQEEIFAQLQLIAILLKSIQIDSVKHMLLPLLPLVLGTIRHPNEKVRHQAARVILEFVRELPVESLNCLIVKLLPMLETKGDDGESARRGAVVVARLILERIGEKILPYLSFFVVPLLGRMSDPSLEVREQSSLGFAALVRLVPLEQGVADPAGMSPELVTRRAVEREFLDELADSTKIKDFQVPIPINATLRRYQQDGVNWLSFLRKFNLNGILCDDMGLGKTLQTLCIVVSDVAFRRSMMQDVIPSIVVCPSTLVNHWCYEIEKFVAPNHLFGIPYQGNPDERAQMRKRLQHELKDNVLVMSYQTLKSDIDHFEKFSFNYCILDEGHIIKNHKSELTKSVKKVKAFRRLILSGTPIQNNVVELWSLFDFLMPGYLGDHKHFNKSFAKPIQSSYNAKAKSSQQEAGLLALEALHKQVLPFLLRRMKEDVLDDLPPKIIQDYYCELSPLQAHLYETFGKSQMQGVMHLFESSFLLTISVLDQGRLKLR
jgi:TATA-binding protein-associated factor